MAISPQVPLYKNSETICIPATKLLLSALIKTLTKKLYENEKNKPPAEHQGPMLYPLKSFATLQNLVRLSLEH